MEKYGKFSTREQLLRPLIVVLFFLASLHPVFSLGGEAVLSETRVVSGSSVFLEVVVYDEEPSSVSLFIEFLPTSLKEIASRKEIRSTSTNSIATVFVYEYLATSAGSFKIGNFIITSKKQQKNIPSVELIVTPSVYDRPVSLRWQLEEGRYQVGTPISIVLEGFGLRYVDDVKIDCPLPENAMLNQKEIEVLSDGDEWQKIGVWEWTPLYPGSQSLPEASVSYSISGVVSSKTVEKIQVSVQNRIVSKLPEKKVLSDFFLTQYKEDSIHTGVAKKIAILRAKEYNSFFAFSLKKERVLIEKELGLNSSFAVYPKNSWIPFACSCGIFFALFGLFFVVSRIKKEKSRLPILFFLFAVILCIFSVYLKVRSNDLHVVTKGTFLYNVPEFTSLRGEKMHEGTTVRVTSRVGSWLYVVTPSQVSGWLPLKDVFDYMYGEIEQ